MKDFGEAMKAIAALLLTLITGLFVPCLPRSQAHGDPVALSDPRIKANISSADLTQMLQLARGARFSSLYQRYFVQTKLPLHFIGRASPTLLIEPGKAPLQVSPSGEIEAIFSATCRPDCQDGKTYFFRKIEDQWHISKITSWVS
jgi:hypothetical protein